MINIMFTMLKEILLSLIGKIAFKAIGERFATRLVIFGLNQLKSYSTNDVVQETVDDIIASLKGKRLKVADELPIQ